MSTLPQGWTRATLGDIISIRNGYAFRSADFCKQGVPVVKQSNLTGHLVDLSDCVFVPATVAKDASRFVVKRGDVLLGMSGSIGEPSVYPYDFDAVQNQRTGLVQFFVNDNGHREFIKQALIAFEGDYTKRGKGVGVQNVSAEDIQSTEIPLPPLPEQQRIVAKIDRLSTKSRRARDQLDHVPRLVEKYKQAILAAAFRGDLTREWRRHHTVTPPEFGVNNIDQRVAELGKLSDAWAWAAICDIADISGGLTKNAKRALITRKVPYLRVANVYANELRLDDIAEIGCTESELKKTLLKKGDLLIVEGNGSHDQIGRVAIWKDEVSGCSHQNHIIRGRTRADTLPAYVLYWLLSPAGRAAIEAVASSSSGLYTLSISKVEGLPIPVCDKSEQHEVIRRVKAAIAWIDRLASETERARKLIDHLDQAVLAKAFRGELVPQDPNDEHASVLLERIRAERQAANAQRVRWKEERKARRHATGREQRLAW